MTRRFQNFINGRSIPPNSNDWIDSVNPATGEVWAQIARSNVVDVRLAVSLRRGLLSNMIGGIILLIGPKFSTILLIGWIASIRS